MSFVVLALFACSGGVVTPAATNAPIAPIETAPPAPVAPVAPVPPAAPVGKVYFIAPVDGAIVTSPVHVVFGIDGMAVLPAGSSEPNSGHHHVIIDGGPIPAGTVVPKDDRHLHFGQGQIETDVVLTAGQHTLTLQFADGAHVSYGEAWSATITVIGG